MKIVTVVGARPQFIKAATVSRVIAQTAGVDEVLVHTGQHYDDNMSDVFFREMDIPSAQHRLGIGSMSHGAQTGRMLEAIETILLAERPAWVLVYGDTNSTMAGALAAAKLHIPVAHVEAGLRSFNRAMPEEINRIVTDHVSTLLFAPTETAVQHLAHDGIRGAHVVQAGDVMYDAALYYADRAAKLPTMSTLGLKPKAYCLSTIHRAENTDDPARLEGILRGLAQVAQRMPVVVPLHPRTRHRLATSAMAQWLQPLQVLDPVGYFDMINLEKNAAVIATDSGGVQKEAYFYGVPCVTLRDETEWVELVEAGWNQLVSAHDAQAVAAAVAAAVGRRGAAGSLYGDGHAAKKIVQVLQGKKL